MQAHSTKDKKGKGKWNESKGKGGCNNSTGRSHQQEVNSLNQRQPINQSNHRGCVAGRGIGGGRKPDKSHIQCFNFQKHGHYSSDFS